MAAVTQARYKGDNSLMPGMAAIMPAAIVMATVEEPTEMRTSAATMNATTTSGRLAEETALPMTSPKPEFCSSARFHSQQSTHKSTKASVQCWPFGAV